MEARSRTGGFRFMKACFVFLFFLQNAAQTLSVRAPVTFTRGVADPFRSRRLQRKPALTPRRLPRCVHLQRWRPGLSSGEESLALGSFKQEVARRLSYRVAPVKHSKPQLHGEEDETCFFSCLAQISDCGLRISTLFFWRYSQNSDFFLRKRFRTTWNECQADD